LDAAGLGGSVEEAEDVLTHIFWPLGDELFEARPVAGIEGAQGFLVAGKIACDSGHKAAGSFEGEACAGCPLVLGAGLVDQTTQGCRGSVWLQFQPLPVTREQRDFTADDAKGAAASTCALRAGMTAERCPEANSELPAKAV